MDASRLRVTFYRPPRARPFPAGYISRPPPVTGAGGRWLDGAFIVVLLLPPFRASASYDSAVSLLVILSIQAAPTFLLFCTAYGRKHVA